ncbi:MAG: SDR family oxidoreductase [Chloroflexota bacterium]
MHCVLITGSAGFLGRYISRHFTQSDWKVIGLDIIPEESVLLSGLHQYVRLNLPDTARLENVLRQCKPELCIHAAGRASVGLSVANPAADFHAGPPLVFHLLDSLRVYAPECRFIFLSSAAVYGNPQKLPVDENQPLAPLSPYGYHKWQSELLCQEFTRVYEIPTASVRIFSAYGPGLRRQVVWDICKKALCQHEIKLQGTGAESRDFIHASDVALGIYQVARTAPMQGEIYNLANGQEVRIRQLCQMVLAALEIDAIPLFDGIVPDGNPLNWCADISRIQALDFKPEISLEDGIRGVAHWCRAELKSI